MFTHTLVVARIGNKAECESGRSKRSYVTANIPGHVVRVVEEGGW